MLRYTRTIVQFLLLSLRIPQLGKLGENGEEKKEKKEKKKKEKKEGKITLLVGCNRIIKFVLLNEELSQMSVTNFAFGINFNGLLKNFNSSWEVFLPSCNEEGFVDVTQRISGIKCNCCNRIEIEKF